MRTGAATATQATANHAQRSTISTSADYGGLVGDLLTEIETRMVSSPSFYGAATHTKGDTDLAHICSIALGYIGLAAGFAVTGAAIVWAIA